MRLAPLALLVVLLCAPLVLTPSASALDLCDAPECQPPPAEQGSPFEFQLVAEEGCLPYRFSMSAGALPPGLGLTTDGKLEGTPTEAGQFDFYVALDDNGGPQNPNCLVPSKQSQGHIKVTVLPDLAVATTSLPGGAVGRPYSSTLEAANLEVGWRVVWDVTQGSLPAGLSLSEGGVISGTPVAPGSSTVTIRVREPFRRSGERQLTLTVAAALSASASSPRVGEVGVRYSGKATATGGTAPFTWSVAGGALPNGLTLDPASGAISGVPTSPGSFSAQLGVRDASGQAATVAASIRVAARLAVGTHRLPRAVAGRIYRARLAVRGGVGPRRFAVSRGALPRGVALGARSGILHGVPRRAGTYRFTVRVRDPLGGSATRALRIVVH